MSPRLAAPKRKIVGIGYLPVRRLLRLDDLVGNTPALAIGVVFFLVLKVVRELLLHIGGGVPAHEGLDRAGLFWFVVKLPFPGLGPARLHRVLGGLKNASGHGWHDPLRNAILMRLA